MGALRPFPFLFPSFVEKRTAETEFWDDFIVPHAGDVNENGAILPSVFVKYGRKLETFLRFFPVNESGIGKRRRSAILG